MLPVLNNLLENREMHLEDGRLLIPSDRYDELLKVISVFIACCLKIHNVLALLEIHERGT